jgi:hypothetical protein
MLAILVMTSADEILSLGLFFNMSIMIARSMGCFCSSMAAMIYCGYICYWNLVEEILNMYTFQIDWRVIDNVGGDIELWAVGVTSF